MHDLVRGSRRGELLADARLPRAGPLVDERGVDGAHDHAEPRDDVGQAVVHLLGRDRAVEHAVGVGEVAQQQALGARDAHVGDVAAEVARTFDHVAQDRLGPQLEVARPRHLGAILLEGGDEQVLERPRVGDLLEALDALLVVDAVRLHAGVGLLAGELLLTAQDLVRVLERCLGHRDHVERVGVALGVEQLEGCEQEGRERLVEGEVLGQVDCRAVGVATVLTCDFLHHPSV